MPLSRTTQQAIADQLGLAASTVSLALRDAPQIAQETRAQVQLLAQELGYQQRPRQKRPTARAAGAVHHIAFVMRFALTNSFYTAVLDGASNACREVGIALHYSVLKDDVDQTLNQIEQAHALLLVGAIEPAIVEQFRQQRRPLVLVDNSVRHLAIDRILTEHRDGVYAAVRRLAELGHSKIAFLRALRHNEWYSSFRERLAGYQEAMADLGYEPIILSPTSADPATAITAWLAQHGRPTFTALIVYNDHAAAMALYALQKHGVEVPRDVSVVGFDDDDISEIVRPQLTTCHIDRVRMGRAAVQTLLERAAQPSAVTKTVLFDTVLIERDSTRALNT